jgi:hypothetical protein
MLKREYLAPYAVVKLREDACMRFVRALWPRQEAMAKIDMVQQQGKLLAQGEEAWRHVQEDGCGK